MFPVPKVMLALLTAAVLGLGLVACGDNAGDDDVSDVQTASNGDVFNDVDVQFAQEMIPHHAQAMAMVVLMRVGEVEPEVEELASDIRDAQVPEVETMSDWLTAWGEDVPETSLDHSNAGHDTSDMGDDMDGLDA